MRKSNMRLLRGLFIILVLGGLTLVHAAQFQNPIQAAKDAYNKAKRAAQQQKQQQQQQQQRQQPGQQQAPAQSGSAAPGGDCCSPEALKKIAASFGFVDIVGIKLGMTPEQATAVIRAYKPTLKIEVLNTRLFHPGSDQFLRVPRYISAQEPNSKNGYESITVEFTQPPSPPLVSKIERYVQMPVGQPVMASSMLESLRKKYGQDNFSQNDARAWIYDLSGKLPVRLPNTAVYCTNPLELVRGTGQPQADYGELSVDTAERDVAYNLNTPGYYCMPYVAVVARPVGEAVAPNTQLIQLTVTLQSGELVYNSAKATYNWLKAEADAKAKEQEDTAKSRTGPKL